jgi:hypothetical protein
MYKVIKSKEALIQIDTFISNYLEKFLSLYEDSWLEDVNLIEKNYIDTSIALKIKILESVKKVLENNIVWKKVSEDNQLSVIISVWNYRLFVDFTEDESQKFRMIENIEFYKK